MLKPKAVNTYLNALPFNLGGCRLRRFSRSPPPALGLHQHRYSTMQTRANHLYELERRKASEAARVLREWQERKPWLLKRARLEGANQGELEL